MCRNKPHNFLEQKAEWFHERRTRARENCTDFPVLDIEDKLREFFNGDLYATETESKIAAWAYYEGRMDELRIQSKKRNNTMSKYPQSMIKVNDPIQDKRTPLSVLYKVYSEIEQIGWGCTACTDEREFLRDYIQPKIANLLSYLDKQLNRFDKEKLTELNERAKTEDPVNISLDEALMMQSAMERGCTVHFFDDNEK